MCLSNGVLLLKAPGSITYHTCLHEACLQVRTAWVPPPPHSSTFISFPQNLRLIENKDRMVVSIMGSSWARNKTWCWGLFHRGKWWCYIVALMEFLLSLLLNFPCGSYGKESGCIAGDSGLSPGLGRFTGEGNGYALQDTCLENSMERGAWWVTVPGIASLVGSSPLDCKETRVGHDWVTFTFAVEPIFAKHSSWTGTSECQVHKSCQDLKRYPIKLNIDSWKIHV